MFKKVPVYLLLIVALLSSAASFCWFKIRAQREERALSTTPPIAALRDCNYSLSRLKGYRYIKPLMFAGQNCESEKYQPLKAEIQRLLDQHKLKGDINSAAVYILDFDEEAWIAVNGTQKFDPGSLVRLPLLITALRMSEEKPSVLDNEITYNGVQSSLPVDPDLQGTSIQAGRKYTVRELLRYMIVNSDNNATALIQAWVGAEQLAKTFADVDLPAPNTDFSRYRMNVREFSVFLNVLYDAGYLSIKNSEFAISLLSQCPFKQGILRGVPADIKIAHKFGESDDNAMHQIHETSIVYLKKSPYLLTVMSSGKNDKQLTGFLSDVSKVTYENMEKYN